MNDGTIHLPLSSWPRLTASDANMAARIISMPPDLPPDFPMDKPLQGQVVSYDKNILVLKTEQGMMSIDMRQPHAAQIKTGDMLQIRISHVAQLSVQQVQNTLALEILAINGQNIKAPPVAEHVPQPSVTMADHVTLPQQNSFEAYAMLRAQLLGLPQDLDHNALEMVIKTLLRLPLQDPLPPSLQEGFDKFLQLVGLLRQANLLPEQQLQSGKTSLSSDIPQGLLTALQNILQPKQGQENPLVQNLQQNLIQLQTVFPGEKLSPNILVDIRQQLMTILSEFKAYQAGQSIQNPAGSSALLMPGAESKSVTPSFYTLPAIGIVLGMSQLQNQSAAIHSSVTQTATTHIPTAHISTIGGNHLVLMMTPDGQNLTGFLSDAALSDGKAKPLLPGTVLVAAFQPQGDKTLSIPLLPVPLLANIPDGLHLTLGDTWPALDALWQNSLAQAMANPDAATLLRQTIPAPQIQQFPPALLFFMAAIKQGLFENWLSPERLSGLNKIETIKQLLNDMRAIQTSMMDDGNPDTWKPLPVPMQLDDQLVRLQFFYRHPDDGFTDMQNAEQAQEKHRKTRFILNVPQTNLGDLQIDGLVQAQDLEMILRTEHVLPSQAEQDMRSRYQSVLETTGMRGNIIFQSGREHYIRV